MLSHSTLDHLLLFHLQLNRASFAIECVRAWSTWNTRYACRNKSNRAVLARATNDDTIRRSNALTHGARVNIVSGKACAYATEFNARISIQWRNAHKPNEAIWTEREKQRHRQQEKTYWKSLTRTSTWNSFAANRSSRSNVQKHFSMCNCKTKSTHTHTRTHTSCVCFVELNSCIKWNGNENETHFRITPTNIYWLRANRKQHSAILPKDLHQAHRRADSIHKSKSHTR